jgi:hypothetical protein
MHTVVPLYVALCMRAGIERGDVGGGRGGERDRILEPGGAEK